MSEKPKLVFPRKGLNENAAMIGLDGEIIAITDTGLALHDGETAGGILLQPRIVVAGENLIRNGNFIIAQNGGSWQSIPTSGDIHYIADGWHYHRTGGSTANIATQRSYVDDLDDAYIALRATTVSGGLASSSSIISQQFADARMLDGRTATLSYWARATTPRRIAMTWSRTYGNSPDFDVTEDFIDNAELGTSWQFYEHTFDVSPVTSSKVFGTVNYSALWFWMAAGSDFDARTGGIGLNSGQFDISNVKLEIGSAATPFGITSGEDELEKVMRYYEKVVDTQLLQREGAHSTSIYVNRVSGFVPFRMPKVRATTMSGVTYDYTTSESVVYINRRGFNVIADATSDVSAARVLGYTADAEFLPYY